MKTASPEAEAAPENGNVGVSLTAKIVAAYVGNNNVAITELPNLIRSVFTALGQGASQGGVAVASKEPVPAVSIKQSVHPDYIVCLEDGKKFKMLKRYLRSAYNLSPDEYRAKWSLPPDYPMVAPNYAAQRSASAKRFGLGRKSGTLGADISKRGGRAKKAVA